MAQAKTFTSAVYIESTPEHVWEGITDPQMTRRWYFSSDVQSNWQVGSHILYTREGQVLIDGAVCEIDPPYLLVSTFSARFHPQAGAEPPCRLAWTVEQLDGVVRLSAMFDDVMEGSATEAIVSGGLGYPLQTLKAILETGRPPVIASITFDCTEPARLAAFWTEVTGYVPEGGGADWAGLHEPHGMGPRLLFMRVPERKTVKNRVHLDIRSPDREAEVARLTALGASVLQTITEHSRWTVMADPEGNEFCVA